jgi:type I restriction enzyme S subunit
MSFPRYPKYKDSGVEWLGEVPEHWEVKRLRYLSIVRKGRLPSGTSPMPSADTDMPYLSMEYLRGETDTPSFVPVSQNLLRAESGDLLLLWDGSNAGEFLRAKQGVVSSTVALIEPRNVDREFLFFACKARERQLKDQTVGMGIPHVSGDELRDFLIPCPPLPEQTAIAEFLDRETGKIDELVAEQRRLMELLKEKRQAVISHAVTRGLNPAAPLKPSGIEWLGDVPAHWELRKLSQLFRAAKGKNGQMLTKEFCAENPGDYAVYSGQTENEGVMGTWNQFEFEFDEEGVLFSTTVGSGKVMSLRHIFGKFSLSQNCMIIWPRERRCHTRFFYFHFQPLFDYERNLIPQHMQASFRMEDLYSYRIAVPPPDEQLAISAFLDGELAKFDTLTAEAQRAIALLQERRTALISAAVTGQIDVRSAGL